jgi:hypothetical protein
LTPSRACLLGALVEKDDSLRAQTLREAGEVLKQMVGMRQRSDLEAALLALHALAGRDLGDEPSAWRAWVEQALARAESTQPSPVRAP